MLFSVSAKTLGAKHVSPNQIMAGTYLLTGLFVDTFLAIAFILSMLTHALTAAANTFVKVSTHAVS